MHERLGVIKNLCLLSRGGQNRIDPKSGSFPFVQKLYNGKYDIKENESAEVWHFKMVNSKNAKIKL